MGVACFNIAFEVWGIVWKYNLNIKGEIYRNYLFFFSFRLYTSDDGRILLNLLCIKANYQVMDYMDNESVTVKNETRRMLERW